jgi:N6-adenosine-specific RNA methylase IME4
MSDVKLIRYDAACRAVALAKTVDEAKKIRNEAAAMRAYAKQAKNKDMEADAVEIRMRATRRLGQMVKAQDETVGLARPPGSNKHRVKKQPDARPTLSSQGIDKNLAHQARALRNLSDNQFENAVTNARKAVQRTVKIEADRNVRMSNLATISRGNAALGTAEKFPIIYADPPWQYENPPIGATNRAIENHYPTMTIDEICALPVGEIATKDAVLFLWATAPKLSECMRVIEAWGFQYRTNMVWVKNKIGMGYHVRNQHELLLIAKRGEVPVPLPKNRPSSVVNATRGAHSEKPEVFHEIIEKMYPELPKIELFARAVRSGWTAWGNQTDAD